MPSGQPRGERITWDDSNERHLLLIILASVNPTNLDWATIARDFGHGLSASAASQKYSKIRARDASLSANGGSGSVGTPSTPKGKKASATVTPKSTGKRTHTAMAGSESDDDELVSPPKASKGKKEGSSIKQEIKQKFWKPEEDDDINVNHEGLGI